MGRECRKETPGVRRYKGGAMGEREEKQPKQFGKKNATMEPKFFLC